MFLPSNITLQFGDAGDFVTELQRRLALVHCFNHDQVNGFYDGNTVNAVTTFQTRSGLRGDGIAGPETLRRLNGTVSGDSGSTDDKKEEEQKQLAQSNLQKELQWADNHPPGMDAAPITQAETKPEAPAYATPAVEPLAATQHQISAEQLRQQEQLLREPVQPPQANATDILAQMLLQNPPPQQQQAAQAQPPMAERPPLQAAQHQAPPQTPVEPQQPAPAAAVHTQAAAPAQPLAEPAAEPQKQTILQKTKLFANEMVQKLANYFEAKLPPSVLQEVQQIGQAMAMGGVKEAPIPTGPEMRGQDLPSRGPDQQQQQSQVPQRK